VTVPNNTVFVFARTQAGALEVHDYRTGTLMGFVGRGRLTLVNVGGTVFAQSNRGPLIVQDSSFDRLRARSLFGNITFEHCSVRQIEATSVTGSIVFDSGSFEPGLARFASARGNVAIGALGAVQMNAHAGGDGRVYTSFDRSARVSGGNGGASAAVGSGGPVVTATSETGNVYLYDGSLHLRSRFPQSWQAPLDTLERPAFDGLRDPGAALRVPRAAGFGTRPLAVPPYRRPEFEAPWRAFPHFPPLHTPHPKR